MKPLSSREKIKVDRPIEYVIDGIPNNIFNKIVLHSAPTLKDFKKTIKIYEEIWKKKFGGSRQKKKEDSSTKTSIEDGIEIKKAPLSVFLDGFSVEKSSDMSLGHIEDGGIHEKIWTLVAPYTTMDVGSDDIEMNIVV